MASARKSGTWKARAPVPSSALGAYSASSSVRRSITVRRPKPASAARPVSSSRCRASERSRVRHRTVPPSLVGYPPRSRRFSVPGSGIRRGFSLAWPTSSAGLGNIIRGTLRAWGLSRAVSAYDAAAPRREAGVASGLGAKRVRILLLLQHLANTVSPATRALRRAHPQPHLVQADGGGPIAGILQAAAAAAMTPALSLSPSSLTPCAL